MGDILATPLLTFCWQAKTSLFNQPVGNHEVSNKDIPVPMGWPWQFPKPRKDFPMASSPIDLGGANPEPEGEERQEEIEKVLEEDRRPLGISKLRRMKKREKTESEEVEAYA